MINITMRVTHYVLQYGLSTTLTATLSTPVFRRNPPQPVHIWPSSQTSFLWHPTHADWGMSKMTPSMNARASSLVWNCFPGSCHLTEWNKHQSQGAKSGEYDDLVTSWISLAVRESRVTAAVCALALSWWSSRPRTPVRWRRLLYAWKILGEQWLTYQPAVTVFLSSSGMVATWPKFAKKHATRSFVWKHLCFFWISQVSSHLGRPTPPTVASFRGPIGIPRFRLLWQWPNLEDTFLHHIFLACGCTSPPYPAFTLHFGFAVTERHNVFLHQSSREEYEWDLPMKSSVYFSVCLFGVLFNHGLYPRNVF